MFDKLQEAYQAFRSQYAERTTSVLIWIGSGLSVPAGLPTWIELRKALCETLANKLGSLDPPDLHAQKCLDHARQNGDLWAAFQILKRELGATSYSAAIRAALNVADNAPIPAAYKSLWSLRIGGLLNLNLDRLATRAFSDTRPGKQVTEFSGRQAGDFGHVLQSPTVPFIANVHGIVSDESSWVFTRKDLNVLLATAAYRHFIAACLTSRTILFMGLTAEDVAVGGHLQELKNKGVSFGSHYWLTSRTDRKTDQAAERLGMRVIRYPATAGDHSAVHAMLQDLGSFVSYDDAPPPVVPTSVLVAAEGLPEPHALVQCSPTEIRDVLNRHAVALLSPATPEAYQAYDAFRQKYDRAIYQAWYTSTDVPDNDLLGYTLIQSIASGAFGEVFRARTVTGEEVAIKVLHQEIRKAPGMLESFRRGVRSMRILSEHHLDGMVPYRDAAEIPAFAVMSIVDGPNLKQAIEAGLLRGWLDVMKLALELARTIRRAHALPERVLHRDIRPSNIMLEGLHGSSTDQWRVVVLDFDLSWHRGAYEKSVLHTGASGGYLAPEQLQEIQGVSTRNSGVDSYGFGMTLYFTLTGIEPLVAEHRDADWNARLRSIRRNESKHWVSLPIRIARLIESCTRETQAERWDMSQIEGEIARLANALQSPRQVQSAELVAEELIARTHYVDSYLWNADKLEASIDLATGVRIQLQGRETTRLLRLNIVWTKQLRDRNKERKLKKVGKYLHSGLDQAKERLKKVGWTIDSESPGFQEAQLSASMAVDKVRTRLIDVAKSIEEAVDKLRYD